MIVELMALSAGRDSPPPLSYLILFSLFYSIFRNMFLMSHHSELEEIKKNIGDYLMIFFRFELNEFLDVLDFL